MPHWLLYLACLVAAAAALRRLPVRSPSQAGILWFVGSLATRAPSVFLASSLESARGRLAPLAILLEGAGAVLSLVALWYLVHDDRERRPRLRWYRILFAASLVLPGFLPRGSGGLVLLSLPLLASFRWRLRLGAGGLIVANAMGLLTFLLGLLTFEPWSPELLRRMSGVVRFSSQVRLVVALYALMSLFKTGSRIHLSIRSVSRRLVGSHLLAAAIPFTLAALFLLLSGALFLSSYRSTIATRMLQASAARAQRTIEDRLEAGLPPPSRPFGGESRFQALLWRDETGAARAEGDTVAVPADSVLMREESSAQVPLLWDGHSLWLRARPEGRAGATGQEVPTSTGTRIEALARIDSLWLSRISEAVGEPVRLFPGLVVSARGGGLQIGSEEELRRAGELEIDGATPAAADSAALRRLTRAIGPPGRPGFRIPGGATLECLFWSGSGWTQRTLPVASSAGFGEQVASLFRVGRQNPFSIAVLIALGIIAVLFLGTIASVTGIVLDMGRTVTRAVQALTRGADALKTGNLEYRIPVQGSDDLWRVADSFNEMAEGLQRVRGVELEQQRLEEELRLARAIQTRLLPAAPPASEHLELAGLSLPAREIGGDYYDYLHLEDGRIGIAVADVSGKGAPAALLMSAFRASLRSQDLGRLGAAEALGRINRFIHESVDPGKFITAFLALIDPVSGEIRYANAGHDAPVVLRADGTTSELTGGGLILGMLPQIVYEEATARIAPGSTLAVFTDGVTEARNEAGDFFGPERLIEALRDGRSDPCSRVLQRLVDAIESFAGSSPQADDITVILARRR